MIREFEILVDHNAFQITILERGLLHIHHKKGAMKVSDFKKIRETVFEYSKNINGVFVMNTSDPGFNFETETWRYIRKNSDSFTFIKAQVLVTELLQLRILAKFHAKVTKSKTIFKVVANELDGLDWLHKKMIELQ